MQEDLGVIAPEAPAVKIPGNLSEQTVLSVHHWTDRLFSLVMTRDPSFRFENGQFVMIGLIVDGKPLLRAYSVASPNHSETLEFLSIKVPDGPLTSRLQHVQVGDKVLVGRKPVGTLLLDNLRPGRALYMIATGTGLAPFLSLAADPEVYARFDHVVITHTCRRAAELAYAEHLTDHLPNHEFLGEDVSSKLIYYPSVTREPFKHEGRITDLITSGKLFADTGLPPLDPAEDRVMICGSQHMLDDLKAMLLERGFTEGNSSHPGDFVIEKAFAER
ncbi:ferredoxin--NADP reductase [Acidisphaera sp. L21]|uniref:ferredoxin--NADP reductase n=1 Tax=Acidisphaera sp. L21 TaxID=1641851 RepID=UPI00131BC58B|nr:ferredoxin--NADP reductase [Acidisphaera sp. L21]